MNAADTVEQHNLGVRLAREHRYGEAIDCFYRAAQGGLTTSYKALYATLISSSRISEAWRAARAYLSFVPLDYDFANHFFGDIFEHGLTTQPTYRQVPVADRPFVSFVLCSHRDARFAAVQHEIERAAIAYPHETIRIADARSMSEGYQRGFDLSRGEIVVLCHDDVEFVAPDFMPRLVEVMANADMVGIAGSRQMTGPAIMFDGHPHIIGRVIQPHAKESGDGPGGYELCAFSLTALRSPAQALDGVFIAARRNLLRDLRFDAAIPHFHYYDVDISYRAHLSGARVIVASDLTLFHNSRGNYDENWLQAKEYFAKKFPALNGTPGSAHHYYFRPFLDKELIPALSQALNDAMT